MQIVHHKPAARGVSQLMYVGDAEYADYPWGSELPPSWRTPVKLIAVLGVCWLLFRR